MLKVYTLQTKINNTKMPIFNRIADALDLSLSGNANIPMAEKASNTNSMPIIV